MISCCVSFETECTCTTCRQNFQPFSLHHVSFQFSIDLYCSVIASCSYDDIKESRFFLPETYEKFNKLCAETLDGCKDAIGRMAGDEADSG